MANKMTKVPAWPFLVMVNLRSYWPYNSQFMTFFYWDSSDKNLKQKHKWQLKIVPSKSKTLCCFFFFFFLIEVNTYNPLSQPVKCSQLVSIPVNVPMHKADQDNVKNFDQYFECPGTCPPPGFVFYQGFLEISMIKELQLLILRCNYSILDPELLQAKYTNL
jgi:hypothetical protein